MSKTFKFIDPGCLTPQTSQQHPPQTNWKLCMICQEDNLEPLTIPTQYKRKDFGSGYSSVAKKIGGFQ